MRTNQLKAGVVLTYLSTALSMLIAFLYTPVMLGILGQSEYGIYTLVNSVIANLGILSFGFGSAYMRFYSKYKVKDDHEGIAKLNGMFITVFCVIAVIALFAGGVLVRNIENIFDEGLTTSEIETATVLMKVLIVNIAISFPASVFTSFITANEKYIFLKVINMIKVVISPMLNLPILLLGYGSVGMVVTTLVFNIFADILNITFSVKKLNMSFNFRKLEFGLLKEIWLFSFFIFLNIITDQINWNVDKFLLGMYKGAAEVAIYGVAAQLNNHYVSISMSVSNVFIPRVNTLVAAEKDSSELSVLFTKIGRIQFMILALILEIYVFFGSYFLKIWAGEEYGSSYYVGLILILSVTIESIQNVGIAIQRAKNLHKFRSVVCFCIAIMNVLLSIPMCKFYGAIGASIGTAISLVIGNGLIINIYYHKRIGLNMHYFWRSILTMLPALCIPTLYGIIMNRLLPLTSIYMFVLQVTGIGVIYALSMFFFGMNDFERNLIKEPLKKLLCKKKNFVRK